MIRLEFKNWLIEWSGMDKDFSSMPLDQRLAQGKDLGEEFVRMQLRAHGVIIQKPSQQMDKIKKIDGFLNNEPVQIKCRRGSDPKNRNDLPFELCINHENNQKLSDQIKNPQKQGRDYKGIVSHYFVMNKEETKIYHLLGSEVKKSIYEAIEELNKLGGHLNKKLSAKNGVDLVPGQDPDSLGFAGKKVMAYVPATIMAKEVYDVLPKDDPRLIVEKPKSEIDLAIEKAKAGEPTTISIKSTNPKNVIKKKKEIESICRKNKLKFTDNSNGTVTISSI